MPSYYYILIILVFINVYNGIFLVNGTVPEQHKYVKDFLMFG